MIDRRLDKEIAEHFRNSKSALLLTGARQTGKTFAVRRYARDAGLNLVEINFLEDAAAAMIFRDVRSAKEILLRISGHANKSVSQPNTLIFFDEVQRCPEVVTWIKFLVDEGSCKYALSGSLLGVELNNIRSVPVGYMNVKYVYPLDLYEFAQAVGVSDEVLNAVHKNFESISPVDEVIHNALLRVVRLYLVVGGMPAVVQSYLESNDLNIVEEKQREILTMYRWDICQYDKDNKLKILEIFDLIPSELDAKNKRFVLKSLNEHARFSIYQDGFIWLKDAGVALPVYNVTEPKIPLKLNEQRNLFKLFLCDVGLLASQYAGGLQLQMLSGNININYGAIYENFVAQELIAHDFGGFEREIYYYNDKKNGELDFVVTQGDVVVPIEVKSGKDYTRHRALQNVIDTPNYAINTAYVLSNSNISVSGKVTYLPIYMTMFLSRTPRTGSRIYRLNLSDL